MVRFQRLSKWVEPNLYQECARFVFLDPLPNRIVGFQGLAAGTACFVAPEAASSEWTQRDLRLGLFCSSQGPLSVLVDSLLDNLTKQRRVLVTSCRLYRQLPTKTENGSVRTYRVSRA